MIGKLAHGDSGAMATDLPGYTADQLRHHRSLDYMRWVSAVRTAEGPDGGLAAKIYAERFPRTLSSDLVVKAATSVMSSADATTGAPFLPLKPLSDAFLSYVRAATIVDRLNYRRVPFYTPVPSQTSAGTYRWVGQGMVKPATFPRFSSVTLPPAKAAGIIVLTEELVKLSTPSAVEVMRGEMTTGIVEYLDQQFLDPSIAAIEGVNPASVTNGVVPITPSGTSAAALLTDAKALIAAFVASNPRTTEVVLIMSPGNALALSIASNSSTLGMAGGTIFGATVLTSGSAGDRIVILDPRRILVADEGGVNIDLSRHASIEMSDAPASPPVAATVMVNLWQHDLVGLRAERLMNWRAQSGAVAYIDNAVYA